MLGYLGHTKGSSLQEEDRIFARVPHTFEAIDKAWPVFSGQAVLCDLPEGSLTFNHGTSFVSSEQVISRLQGFFDRVYTDKNRLAFSGERTVVEEADVTGEEERFFLSRVLNYSPVPVHSDSVRMRDRAASRTDLTAGGDMRKNSPIASMVKPAKVRSMICLSLVPFGLIGGL